MKKLFSILALLLLGIFGVSYSWAEEVRVWTSGKYTIEGEFVEFVEGDSIVRIRKTNGKVVRIPLSKLSQEDQEYVKDSGNPFEEEDTKSTLPASSEKPTLTGTTFPASLKPGKEAGERKVLTVEGIEYAFRWCPPGEFMMGSTNGSDDEKPVHKVKLTRGFWLLETEVTQSMWQSVMGENPSDFKGDQNPVEWVSWNGSQSFCQKLSQKLGQQVQLPTEAQWEYACRAGTTGDYAGDLDEMAWYNEEDEGSTHPVAQKKPNAWGLYDMHGNIWEWCSDYFDEKYYDRSPTSDPENTTVASSIRVLRGGCWCDGAEFCRSANRFRALPDDRIINFGLRVLLVPSPAE